MPSTTLPHLQDQSYYTACSVFYSVVLNNKLSQDPGEYPKLNLLTNIQALAPYDVI